MKLIVKLGLILILAIVILLLVSVLGVEAQDPAGPTPEPTVEIQIVGGHDAVQGTHPSQVALIYIADPQYTEAVDLYYSQFCGGTVIASEWVVTALHCTPYNKENIGGAVGTHDLKNKEGVTLYPVLDIITPGDSLGIYPDIALLRIPKIPNAVFMPVASPYQGEFWEQTGTIWGWGTNHYFQSYLERKQILQVANVPILSDETCQSAYPGDAQGHDICAGYLEFGGVDTCQGDSGGPLLGPPTVNVPYPTLLGVTSRGYLCAQPNYPGVYTQVSVIKVWEWIKSVIGEARYEINPIIVTSGQQAGAYRFQVSIHPDAESDPSKLKWSLYVPSDAASPIQEQIGTTVFDAVIPRFTGGTGIVVVQEVKVVFTNGHFTREYETTFVYVPALWK